MKDASHAVRRRLFSLFARLLSFRNGLRWTINKECEHDSQAHIDPTSHAAKSTKRLEDPRDLNPSSAGGRVAFDVTVCLSTARERIGGGDCR